MASSNIQKIALVTCEAQPVARVVYEDNLLAGVFKKCGIECIPVPWSAHVNWQEFDAIIIRSCHDYYKRTDDFRRWMLDRKSHGRPRMLNPPETILWNMDKTYLNYYKENGVRVCETVYVKQGTPPPCLREVLDRKLWNRAVIKPIISASAFRTYRVDTENASELQAAFENDVIERGMMIQQYLKEIQNGEYACVFLGRVYSHAVLRIPAKGDFRTLGIYGGKSKVVDPPSRVRNTAEKVLSLVQGDLLYARVDMVATTTDVHLMELELIEPYLYLNLKEGSAEKLAEAFGKLVV